MTLPNHILRTYLGILPGTPEAMVLRLLVELAVQHAGADEGSLLVLDDKKNRLVFAMTTGESEKTLIGQHVPLGKGLTGLAAVSREVQIGAPRFKDIKQRKRAGSTTGQPTAVIAAPMLIRDEPVGVITAVSFDPDKRFTDADASLYAKTASVAAAVVDQNRRLRQMSGPGRAGRHETEIVESVARLVRHRAGNLKEIRSLLAAIDSLCSRSEST
ncbi:MAG: GAF domain-containing protein [Planctomycetota bacterium]|nr:GAF domain-containing protein [Planctomycetota bacterium]